MIGIIASAFGILGSFRRRQRYVILYITFLIILILWVIVATIWEIFEATKLRYPNASMLGFIVGSILLVGPCILCVCCGLVYSKYLQRMKNMEGINRLFEMRRMNLP